MTRAAVIIGLLAILAGVLLSKRPDQPSLRPQDQNCIDPASPPLNRATTLFTLCIEGDWFSCSSHREVRL